jgi:hypothetical protein
VPLPVLTSAQFPGPLHKHQSAAKSTVIVVGTGIGLGDGVNVNGTHGQKPTNWSGTITSHITGNAWVSADLEVDHEEELFRRRKVTAGGGGGPEDVSVTVTNATDTSDPVATAKVPTVP